MNGKYRMYDVKNYIISNYKLRFNKFQGIWVYANDGHFGRNIEHDDLLSIHRDAVGAFKGLSVSNVLSILRNPYGTNRLLEFGIAGGYSYHQAYRDGDIALYFCAGKGFSNPHIRLRFWNEPTDFFKEEELGNDVAKAVELFNEHLKVHKKKTISTYDLKQTPIQI